MHALWFKTTSVKVIIAGIDNKEYIIYSFKDFSTREFQAITLFVRRCNFNEILNNTTLEILKPKTFISNFLMPSLKKIHNTSFHIFQQL